MSQFAALAEPIDRLGGYVEECSDVTNRQQRPQPVRRILGERCENLRSPGIRGCSIPSSCDRLRILATRWIGLIRPSKPLAGGSSPSRRARKSMKCKPEVTLTNHGPFCDVRKLSATDKESLERWSHAFLCSASSLCACRSDLVTSRP